MLNSFLNQIAWNFVYFDLILNQELISFILSEKLGLCIVEVKCWKDKREKGLFH